METPQVSPRNTRLKSDPDAFTFTKSVYERQRKAFAKEYSSLHRRNVAHRNRSFMGSPEFSCKSPMDRRKYHTPGPENSYLLPLRRTPKLMQSFHTLMDKCQETETLPNIRNRVSREKRVLKKYSARMDWTLETLLENAELEYRVLAPLVGHLSQEQYETELVARSLAKEIRMAQSKEYTRMLTLKKKPQRKIQENLD